MCIYMSSTYDSVHLWEGCKEMMDTAQEAELHNREVREGPSSSLRLQKCQCLGHVHLLEKQSHKTE